MQDMFLPCKSSGPLERKGSQLKGNLERRSAKVRGDNPLAGGIKACSTAEPGSTVPVLLYLRAASATALLPLGFALLLPAGGSLFNSCPKRLIR